MSKKGVFPTAWRNRLIYDHAAWGERAALLAARYGISRQRVYQVIRRESWWRRCWAAGGTDLRGTGEGD